MPHRVRKAGDDHADPCAPFGFGFAESALRSRASSAHGRPACRIPAPRLLWRGVLNHRPTRTRGTYACAISGRGGVPPPPVYIRGYFQPTYHKHMTDGLYFTCFPVGLWWQPAPVDFDPHQMHLPSPDPWRCLLVGEWWHPAP